MNREDAKSIGISQALNSQGPRKACPDCGYLLVEKTNPETGDDTDPFICPRCGVHYTSDEFWRLHHDKLSTQADLEI